jgi:sulfur carrier protein ThiS adenylyltransferase
MNPTNSESGANSGTDRFARQDALVPRSKLEELAVSVIGVGAIGRQLAIQLAALGVGSLRLIDFDQVEVTNITTQGYDRADLGQSKVEATAATIHRIDPSIHVATICDRFRLRHVEGSVIFCCVDSITARAAIWRSIGSRAEFWADGRMLGETMRILVAADPHSADHYATTLFAAREAQAGSCTARGTIYTAAIAAGLLVHQFSRWLRGLPVESDAVFNLLAGEYVANS